MRVLGVSILVSLFGSGTPGPTAFVEDEVRTAAALYLVQVRSVSPPTGA